MTAWPALAFSGALFAQAKRSPVVIGWLGVGSANSSGRNLNVFKEGMVALGWKEGSQFVLEQRWADSYVDRLPALAKELAATRPAVIVAYPSQSVAAAAKASPTIPIVQANGSDPVTAGFAASLSRPGGMITGLSNINVEVNEKLLELLLSATPQLRRIGFLVDPGSADRAGHMRAAHRAIARFSVEARFADAARPEEIETAIARLAKEGAQGLVVTSSAWFSAESRRLLMYALAQRWPVVGSSSAFAHQGALLTYGADRRALFRRAAYYVDRILKGAKPGDLPIEQPMVFELVINMKTAKALGITIPPELMVRADRVIE